MQVWVPAVPVGTQDFLSPEVLAAMNGGARGAYGPECDWWSLGVVAYQMIYARAPFTGATATETAHNILNFQVRLDRRSHRPAPVRWLSAWCQNPAPCLCRSAP